MQYQMELLLRGYVQYFFPYFFVYSQLKPNNNIVKQKQNKQHSWTIMSVGSVGQKLQK